jgi:hypothetical protein
MGHRTVHSILNMPQASQLLPRRAGAGGMTKCRVTTYREIRWSDGKIRQAAFLRSLLSQS